MTMRPLRFVLLGHARVGSNVILRSLAAHPEVAIVSEVLHEKASVRELCGRSKHHRVFYQAGDDGARFLDEQVFLSTGPDTVRSCGFKLFYDHARFDEGCRKAWDYVLGERDIRIIHLFRRNLLETLISLQVALRTGKWSHRVDAHSAPLQAEPFRLEPHECQYYFARVTSWQSWAEHVFAEHPRLCIDYQNDTCRDFSGTMARVLHFVGVTPAEVTTILRKQQCMPPQDQVTNFNELREFFKNTPYSSFFAAEQEIAPAPAPIPKRTFAFWRGRRERPTRFILLGHERSGSTLVRRSLDQHPQIAMTNETLSDVEDVRRLCANGNRHRAFYAPGDDGARYLDRKVFLERPPSTISACGIKLFYHHARFDHCSATAWDYIAANRDIRVIHLTRRDLLECRVSHEVAVRTGQWFQLPGSSEPARSIGPFGLPPDECHAYFDNIASWRIWADDAFSAHPMLKIEYEADLCADYPGAMARVFEFLGVDPAPAEISLLRQRTRPSSEQLTNFDELRSYFRHSPYEGFFRHSTTAVARAG